MDSNEIIPAIRALQGDVSNLMSHAGALIGLQPTKPNGTPLPSLQQQIDEIRVHLNDVDQRLRLVEETGVSADFVMGISAELKQLGGRLSAIEGETLNNLDARLRRLEQLAGNNPPTAPAGNKTAPKKARR